MFIRILRSTAFLVCSLSAALSFSQNPKYPQVMELRGKVWGLQKEKSKRALKNEEILRERAHLVSEVASSVRIQLDPDRAIVLMPDSELLIPAISWESGEAPVFNLIRGSLHWKQAVASKSLYNIALTSSLFQFIAPAGDYLVSFDGSKAWTEVKVYQGQLVFSALNAESSVTIKAGQQSGFQGVREDGEIAYDVLLKGKRIPKGQLMAVTPLKAEEIGQFEKAEKAKRDLLEKERRQKLARAKQEAQAGFICKSPVARLDQCSWSCVNKAKNKKGECVPVPGSSVVCIRQRCNANGAWAEKTELTADQSGACRSQVTVGACDY